jgi:hypothetical protein
MHRARSVAVCALVVLVAAACSSGDEADDEFGPCKVEPGVVCTDQDLRNVDLVAADLHGVDLSGSDLSFANMRGADLTGAKLVGATLASTNFEDATLTNVDLSDSFMFFTNFTGADLSGVDTTGAQRCNVVEPNGSITLGELIGEDGTSQPCGTTTATTRVGAKSTGAPTIEYFRLAKPEVCLNDAAGTGVEVEWYAPNANTLTFLVDGIRIGTGSKPRGSVRVPFECDNRTHILSVQAFGAEEPSDTAAFTASLRPTAPLTPND